MACSHQEIEHFRAFGFVVLRGLLSPAEVEVLAGEVRANLTAAYGGVGTDDDPDGTGGIRGDYLPLSVDAAPLSQALMADDPRLFQASAELLGRMTVPTAPIATCFTTNAGWHCDDGTDVGGVKFLAHLEPRAAESGALRVLPGSHLPQFSDRYGAYRSQDPGGNGFEAWPVPCVALETEPGDVIAFDVHCYHSSQGGERRLAWSVEYEPWPGLGDPKRIEKVRSAITDVVDFSHKGYDLDRWPAWDEWAASWRTAPPSRVTAIHRLQLLGVLDENRREARTPTMPPSEASAAGV